MYFYKSSNSILIISEVEIYSEMNILKKSKFILTLVYSRLLVKFRNEFFCTFPFFL